jgi:predicted N-acyltransferase
MSACVSTLLTQASFHPSLATLSAADWAELSPGNGEDWAYFRTLEAASPPGFRLGAIVVKAEGAIVGAAPVFQTVYRFDTAFQGHLRQLGNHLYQRLPRLVSMPVLSLGSPLSDNSQIGLASGLSADQRLAVVSEILRCLKERARKDATPLISAKSLLTAEADEYEVALKACGYARVTTIPNVILDLPFRDLDGYLASLPEKTRSYLRRKWRAADKVRIEHRTSIDDVKDDINSLYASTLAHSAVDYGNFGPVHPDYFAAVLRNMGDRARIMLCWVDGELLSFQLYLVGRDTVFAKGIGMKYPKARDYNLYFVNWKEMIEFCLARGLPRISMSGTTYATKLLIGGRLEQRWILFRFRNGVANTFLPWLAPAFDFESNDPELTNFRSRA